MSTETLTFTFKNVHNGKPIQASQIPPLPPAAVRAMLRILHEKSIALSFAANSPFYAEVMAELATEIVSIALRRVEPLDHALPRRRDLHQRLGRVDLHQRVVQLHPVAFGYLPGHHLGVLEALAEIGEQEVADGHQNEVTRSTAARMRSVFGR